MSTPISTRLISPSYSHCHLASKFFLFLFPSCSDFRLAEICILHTFVAKQNSFPILTTMSSFKSLYCPNRRCERNAFFFAMSNFLLLTTRYEQLNTKIDGKSHSVALVMFKRYFYLLCYISCVLTGWLCNIFPNML